MAQLPAAQVAEALANEQAWPHAPQLAPSPARLVSQPFWAPPSQSAKPASHAPIVQVPALHVAAAWANEHAFPHWPQWLTSVASVTSQPSPACWLQSAKPGWQAALVQAPDGGWQVPVRWQPSSGAQVTPAQRQASPTPLCTLSF